MKGKMLLKKTRSRNRLRPQKQQDIHKHIRKTRRSVARKSKFKSYENPLKTYKAKPKEQIVAEATTARKERLASSTEAEDRVSRLLRESSISFRREEIFWKYDPTGQLCGFVIADFYLDGRKTIIEVDGGVHRSQRGYDRGRDKWFEGHGIRTIRLTNKEVLKGNAIPEFHSL